MFSEKLFENHGWKVDVEKDIRVICTLLAHAWPLVLLSHNFSKCRANTDSKICLSTFTSRILTGAMAILYNVNIADQGHSVSVCVRSPENFFFDYQRMKQSNTG